MKAYIYDHDGASVVIGSAALLATLGIGLAATPEDADFAIAPLLQRKLTADELRTPTLVFHPSLLPRHRGRDAIKWAFKLGEKYTGATWFWANDSYDAGDICEQEVLEMPEGITPREFYETVIVTSALRLLAYALRDLQRGIVRRRPQREEAATYEPPIKKAATTTRGGSTGFLEQHWPVSPIQLMGPGTD